MVMKGYWDNPEATAARSTPTASCAPATWRGSTPSGYVSITGRAKEMIIRGGENIFPAEIENAIRGARRRSPTSP